jgi:aryl-phospho-beta-D-glucosidase BglC (GH1 family)
MKLIMAKMGSWQESSAQPPQKGRQVEAQLKTPFGGLVSMPSPVRSSMFLAHLVSAALGAALLWGSYHPSRAQSPGPDWLPASPEKLPRWRGFNLLNKFEDTHSMPFDEADFRMIHEWGFNFVRIPMDYRIWITNGDWTKIDEKAAFHDLDQAVSWGRQYHIHICLNFHRSPGYTVASPAETASLWTDAEAQRVCAMHWAAFARHYRGIPNEQLSFNLLNEPTDIAPSVYCAVVAKVAAAIRAEDPQRLIICDGLLWGNKPVPELIPLHVAQSTHDYVPMAVTHYRASWIPSSQTWPVPSWPRLAAITSYLYGPQKGDLHSALTLSGAFPAGTRVNLRVDTVSDRARLSIRAGNNVIFQKAFVSGPQSREGEKVVLNRQYNSYQNAFDQTESAVLPAAADRITVGNEEGDWMTLKSLNIQIVPNGSLYDIPIQDDWGRKQPALVFHPAGIGGASWSGGETMDRNWLWENQFARWKALEGQGVGVMVGEFGCNNKTPDDVTVRWMEDTLANFKRAGWGWALWNLKGSFGVIDSNRSDVAYENFEGHKLDRGMLTLLQRY